ncbi:MAG: rodZ, partial [Acidobacteria bacterium]|nr:rodZ [Acidobacteriota bacterium]
GVTRAPEAPVAAEPAPVAALDPPLVAPAPAAVLTPERDDVQPVSAAVLSANDGLTIALTATRPCWVSATVDGKKTIERLLQSGEQQTVAAQRDVVLSVGDAGAIAIRFNGADGRPLGKSGEVVTARFNLNNYKTYLQAR